MSEQTGLLVPDHGEWIFVTDSEEVEPERAWSDPEVALDELRMEGWELIQGPAPVRFDIEGLQQYEGLGIG